MPFLRKIIAGFLCSDYSGYFQTIVLFKNRKSTTGLELSPLIKPNVSYPFHPGKKIETII